MYLEHNIDIWHLVPQKTQSGFNIAKDIINLDGIEWIKLSYNHPKKPQLLIKRYVDCVSFGYLLGQMQAEGTKYTNMKRKLGIEFSNKLIEEHKDFICYLENIGVKKEAMWFKLTDSQNMDKSKLDFLVTNFVNAIGICPKIYKHFSNHGGYGFKTIVSNTLLGEVVLNSMDILRKNAIKNPVEMKSFLDAFFSKLLTGDGSLNVDKRPGYPRVRIRIKDQDFSYLEDYKKIMRLVGFNYVRIYPKHIMVEAYCSFDNLLYLYKVKAFKNTNNWNKLLVAIGLCLKGNRYRTKLRFIDLEDCVFTRLDIADKYSLHSHDWKWVCNMERIGFIERANNNKPFSYRLSASGKEITNTLKEWKKDIGILINLKGTEDLPTLREIIKTRGLAKKTG